MISGHIASIQPTNEIDSPRAATAATPMALGGEATGVPRPPTLDASGIDSANPARAFSWGNAYRTGSSTANIVAAVAVFAMNWPSTAVSSMSASSAVRALSLNGVSTRLARLRSRRYLAAPSAMRKPPRKRMTTGSASAE